MVMNNMCFLFEAYTLKIAPERRGRGIAQKIGRLVLIYLFFNEYIL